MTKKSRVRKIGWTLAGSYGLYVFVSILIGATTGLGAYTFGYAKGFSYFKDDPAACANCHIMEEQHDAWIKSSHGKFASCNDCHTPHDSTTAKYYCKARNGFWHSVAFTSGDFHEPIMIHDYNRAVTEAACRHCHTSIAEDIHSPHAQSGQDSLSCIRCHADVGHATH